MEKPLLFFVRLVKENLVINLESLLLHGNEHLENKYWTRKKKLERVHVVLKEIQL